MYQNARRHIRYHDHRDHPAKDELDQALEDDVGIAGKVHDTEITPDQSLRPCSPEAYGRQGEQNRVVNRIVIPSSIVAR